MEPLQDCPCTMTRDEIDVSWRWTKPREPGQLAGLQCYHSIPGGKECLGPEMRGPWPTSGEAMKELAQVSEAFQNLHPPAKSDQT
jgi:hypothetical protein